MPTPAQILAGLAAIANDWIVAAAAWHAVVAAALIAAALGWRPTARTIALLIAALPASVAAFAFSYGNPFNGVVLAATAIALAALATRSGGAVGAAPRWARWGGIAVLAFGWLYPHFLDGNPAVYLYAAPVGLVPCPTLSVAIGLALVAGGAGPRAWRLTLAGVAAFYAVFGVVRLGVMLDLGLLAGAALLAATASSRVGRRHSFTATPPISHSTV